MASNQNPGGNRGGQQNRGDAGTASRANEGTLGGVTGAVKDAASSVASTAEEAWDSTRQGVQQAAYAVAGTAEDAWGEVTGLMRRYPFGTLAVGIGIGFLLSRLLEERGTGDLSRWSSAMYNRAREYASNAMS